MNVSLVLKLTVSSQGRIILIIEYVLRAFISTAICYEKKPKPLGFKGPAGNGLAFRI